MTIPVLVVDADEEYRNLAVQTLNGSGHYRALPAGSAKHALQILSTSRAQIAIVDVDLPDAEGHEFIAKLLAHDKHLLVIAVVEEGDEQTQSLRSIGVRSILEKPYYLPELPELIKSATRGPSRSVETSPSSQVPASTPDQDIATGLPPWLYDSNQANDFINRLFKQHSAVAMLILRADRLWARSSQITEGHAGLLARMVEEIAEENDSIVRYVQFEDLEGDFLLYATPLLEEFRLVLLYDSEKSFSIARRQAIHLRQLILAGDLSNLPRPQTTEFQEAPVPRLQPNTSTLPGDWIPQSPASKEGFPQLVQEEVPPADPEGDTSQEPEESPQDSAFSPIPADWFPKRRTPSSRLPFLAHDGPAQGSAEEDQVDADREDED